MPPPQLDALIRISAPPGNPLVELGASLQAAAAVQ